MRYWEGSVSIFSYFFSCFFLVCKLWKLGLYIITYFGHRGCFILGFFGFSFLDFSVFKNPKSNHHRLFLAIFLDLEMLPFWSINYKGQVCKLYLYFGHVQNFGQCLYLSVFSEQWKCPTFSFVQYMLYSHCIDNSIFCTFWRPKTLVLSRKMFKTFLYLLFILSKNSTVDPRKTSITQEPSVVEISSTPCWIAFLMLSWFVYNIRS